MQESPGSSLALPLVPSGSWHSRAGSALVFSIAGVGKGDVETYKKCFLATFSKKKVDFFLFFILTSP